jgi:hypothetical protein
LINNEFYRDMPKVVMPLQPARVTDLKHLFGDESSSGAAKKGAYAMKAMGYF